MDLAGLSRIVFMVLPNYSMIAVANAIEVLRMANRTAGSAVYRWDVVTLDGSPAAASNGLMLAPTQALAESGRPDLLFVCGGVDVREAVDAGTVAALRRLARDGVQLGGLCTGSFALAAAGLLRDRTCAIHWENLAAIEEEFPDIEFVRDLYSIDRDRITCTGGIAPLSLMLVLVEARLGPAIAAAIRAQYLVDRARDGSEKQHARPGPPGHPKLEAAVRAIEAAADFKIGSETLAARVGLSVRQLERLFGRHLGQTPAAYAAGLRLDRARSLLRETAMPVTAIGFACGYGTASRFSAAYRGRFGHAPREERAPFRPTRNELAHDAYRHA